jgi:CubicO group peptidase (beta-lactamase class C family)
MESLGVPGVAVGVVAGDAGEAIGLGITSVENPLDVDAETLFQIGSITKTYTAVAALRLVESGSLDLDEPIRTYLPELRLADPLVTRQVTMRHLLTHTGGWAGDYFASCGAGDDALARMVARLDRLEQLTPLGELWSYNNAGFYIAGRVIEVLTAEPYDAALRTLVLDPLGLKRSFFFADEALTYRFAVGHNRQGAVARPWWLARTAAPVGGLIATVTDLLRYARAQWTPDDLLSSASLAEMRRPHARVRHAMGDDVGLGWYLFEADRHRFITHGGATLGQQALLVIGPEDRFALAVLTNHDNGSAVAKAVKRRVFASVLGIDLAEPEPIRQTAEELVEYVGVYDSPLQQARLTIQDEELLLEVVPKGGFPEPDTPPSPAPPPSRLAFVGTDAAIALDPPMRGDRSDFIRTPDGTLAWFRSGGRLHRRTSA